MDPRMAEHMSTATVEQLNQYSGSGVNYVDRWWVTDAQGALLFLHRLGSYSPQCSPRREFVAGLWPGMTAVQVPQVFVPSNFRRGVLTPLTEGNRR